MANTYVERTIATGSTPNKFTISMWIKGKADPAGSTQRSIFGFRDNSDTNEFFNIYFSSNGSLYCYWNDSGTIATLGTLQKFRDDNAWGHFVCTVDTTDATAADRMKFYWNGNRITDFEDGLDTITQNKTMDWLGDTNGRITIGAAKTSTTWHYWDGNMSHVQFVDGAALAPTEFGEVDSTSGIWKIKTDTYGTPGTNGFHLKMEDSTNMDLDSSSNAHTFATSGTLTATEDSPSNNYTTWNTLHNLNEGATYSCGNTKIATGGSNKYTWNNSTLGMTAGKYYAEIKWKANGTDVLIGLTDRFSESATHELGNFDTQYAYRNNGQIYTNNSGSAWASTFAIGDIVGIAVDMDNNKLYFSKNGVWQDSGDPTSGSTGTGALALSASPSDGNYYFSVCGYEDTTITFEANFGDGYFGTTAVSSAGTNASGNGIFEYDVPTGYTALCTKGLNA